MFDYDLDALTADVRRIAPGQDSGPLVASVYREFDMPSPSLLAVAPSAHDAIRACEVIGCCLGLVATLTASLNRAAADGDQQKEANEVTKGIAEYKKRFSSWHDSDDVGFTFVRELIEEKGYRPSALENDILDLVHKWAPSLREAIPYVVTVRQHHEATFVTALLTMGVGDYITPHALIMHQPVLYPQVEQANERLMEAIEESAHGFTITNVVTNNTLRTFVEMMTRAEAERLNLYPLFRHDAEDTIIEAVIAADMGESMPINVGGTRFTQHISTEGLTPTEAIKQALQQVLEAVKSPNYKLGSIVVMDDSGKVISLKEFFEQMGEEVPQSVLDKLGDDD